MGFLSAFSSITRYRVVGDVDERLWEDIPDILKKFSFQDIDEVVDELSFGWVCFDNMLDNMWHTSSPYKGEYVCFSLRIDKRKIPPAVFKKYYQLALEEIASEEKDLRYIPKNKKQEIKENVRLRLLQKILPVPSVTDIIWDFKKGYVYLFTTNKSTKEIFIDLFQRSFNLGLAQIIPYELGKILEKELEINVDKYETQIFAV